MIFLVFFINKHFSSASTEDPVKFGRANGDGYFQT